MTRVLRSKQPTADVLRQGVKQIQQEQGLDPSFPADVEAAAAAAATAPRLPPRDLTALEFVTIDPEGAMDLDQAMCLSRTEGGYVVSYAIADVAAYVSPGDPIDVEAHRRGESCYGADSKIPLHPKALSEGAASLLPDQVCPAFVWTLELDGAGACTSATVERALVKSRKKLTYEEVQADQDSDLFQLLREIGERREAIERERGGVNLPLPQQEISIDDGHWELSFREVLPIENWNAQISLLTGFEAAKMMVANKIGLLRTLPPPPDQAVSRLRRTARALQLDWPEGTAYPEFIRGLDAADSAQAAMLVACTRLLRGAGYVGFNGSLPDLTVHSALASEYAHCTAPLRRLIDRYALEVCASICAGVDVPTWVLDKLDELPATMQESGRRANAYENAIVNLVEVHTLADRVGEQFTAVVLDVNERDPERADIQLRDPAVEATATGPNPPLGHEVQVTLTEATPATRTLRFTL